MFVVARDTVARAGPTTCRVRAATVLRTASVGGGIYGGVMRLTADEIDRFWSHVVKGPHETDCWLWAAGGTAAIGDDGYGRFWVSRDGRQRVLRPHRVAWALAVGDSIDLPPVVEHVVCDNPIVRTR